MSKAVPKLASASARIQETELILSAPEMETIRISQDTPQAADEWLAEFLGDSYHLQSMASDGFRSISPDPRDTPRRPAAGYALLLMTQSSLDALNERLQAPITMEQLRPNLVVSNCEKDADDNWKSISVGSLIMDVTAPCVRCPSVDINPFSGTKDPEGEVLSTLAAYRTDEKGNINMGQYLAPHSSGNIHVGDTVTTA